MQLEGSTRTTRLGLKLLGVKTVLVSNAAGRLNQDYKIRVEAAGG